MAEWFTENSLMPLISGVLLTIIFLGLAYSFYDKWMLIISLVIALLTAMTVTIETLIVTDREAVVEVVHEMAEAVEDNDMERVISLISDQSERTKERVRLTMPNIKANACQVIGVADFSTDKNEKPQTADIDFSFYGSGKYYSSSYSGRLRITLTFQLEGEDWKLINYGNPMEPSTGREYKIP